MILFARAEISRLQGELRELEKPQFIPAGAEVDAELAKKQVSHERRLRCDVRFCKLVFVFHS